MSWVGTRPMGIHGGERKSGNLAIFDNRDIVASTDKRDTPDNATREP